MREYQIEIATDDEGTHCRIQRVQAEDSRGAMKQAKLRGDEWVYQICRKFDDCKLAQPVFDYMNGFEMFDEMDGRETWRDV